MEATRIPIEKPMDVRADEPTANVKRDRPSVAADRFLHDSQRRSCSFVNPSNDALLQLKKIARQNSFTLTSCQEPNVGLVTRLTRHAAPKAAMPAWNEGIETQENDSRPEPTSPSSVIEATSSLATASDKKPLASTVHRVVEGREYDVFDMRRPMAPNITSRTGLPASLPVDVPASPSRLSVPVDVSASLPTSLPVDVPASPCRLSVPVDVSASLPTSLPMEGPTGLPAMRGARRRPSDLMRRDVSFATLSVLTAAVRAVEESDDRPELLPDGTSGVYLLRGSPSPTNMPAATRGEAVLSTSPPVAVFKPSDEEAGSAKNPHGYNRETHMMREGFRVGDGAVRERIAYKLDHQSFAGVPKTALDRLIMRTASGTHIAEQTGSIQEFVPSRGDVGEYRFDGSEFCERASQRVALLDLRLFNCDRHEGNILVRSTREPLSPPSPPQSPLDSSASSLPEADRLSLVPIDHAFILPRFGYFREAEFVWRYWLAAREPFGAEAVEYVARLDVEADVELARRAGLDDSSCATLRTCTMLLQAALLGSGPPTRMGESAVGGMGNAAEQSETRDSTGEGESGDTPADRVTPKALASVWMRERFDEPSALEIMCAQALGIVDAERDTALLDYVQRSATGEAAGFVPPPEFYERFAALLVERYGRVQRKDGPGRNASNASALPLRRVRSCIGVSEELSHQTVCGSAAAPDGERGRVQPPLAQLDEADACGRPCLLRPSDCTVGVHADFGGVPFMEDAHDVRTTRDEAVFAVFDGHGGTHAAHYCREHLPRHVIASLESGHTASDALLAGFARTEDDLLAEQRQRCEDRAMCGTTATLALLRDDRLHLAWLGDCRAVLCRGGAAIELTHDHVIRDGPGVDPGERARVLREGGHVEEGRLSGFLEVARAFGDLDPLTGCKPLGLSGVPELRSQPLLPEDEFVLIASDGLWKLLDSPAAVRTAREDLRAHASVAMAAEKLVEEALQTRRADDNITVLVVLLRPVQPSASVRQRPKLQLLKRGASLPTLAGGH